jgi:hypothetical protein
MKSLWLKWNKVFASLNSFFFETSHPTQPTGKSYRMRNSAAAWSKYKDGLRSFGEGREAAQTLYVVMDPPPPPTEGNVQTNFINEALCQVGEV